MKIDRSLVVIIFLFLALSLAISWKSFLEDGNFEYRDHWTIFDLTKFKEYFLHVYKNFDSPNLDIFKRIVELWIHFFVDYATYDKFKFALLTFAALLSSFYASARVLEKEVPEKGRRYAIAFFTALLYVINPFNTQILLDYYPAINYALFPLFFYFLYSGFTESRPRDALISALIAAFMFLMVVHSLLHIAVSFVPVLMLALKKKAGVFSIARNAVVFALGFFFSTSFILFPYFFLSRTTGVSDGVHTLTSEMLGQFSSVAQLPKAMLLDFHTFWWPYLDYAYPFGNLFFLLLAVFAAVLFVNAFYDRHPLSVAALISLCILFFMAKGNSPPFSSLYEVLNFYTPVVGWLLRVPLKFLYPIPFFFSLLFLRFLVRMSEKGQSALYAAGCISILFLSAFSWPLFTGDMAGILTKFRFDYDPTPKAMNEILKTESSISILYGKDDVSLKAAHSVGERNLVSGILDPGPFLRRELNAYWNVNNWSGLSSLSGLGVKYFITNLDQGEGMGLYSSPVLRQSGYAIYRLKNNSSVFSLPQSSFLCYCHFDTARSLMRDPPPGQNPQMLLFPNSGFNFPASYLESSDYVVLDSSPLSFASVDSGSSFSFFGSTFRSNPSEGWARAEAFADADERYWNEDSAWNWEFEFGKDFAATNASPKAVSFTAGGMVLDEQNLTLEAKDRFSSIDSLSVSKRSHNISISSLVTSDLPLERGSYYKLTVGMQADSEKQTAAGILFFDQYGHMISSVKLFSRKGSFDQNKTVYFAVPYEAVRATLAISSILSENDSSFNITSFRLQNADASLEGKNITALFRVPAEGEYDVYLHLLKSRKGGMVRVLVDGNPLKKIPTYGGSNRLHWEKVYSGNLSPGFHTLTVESLGGFNAVNIGYLRKKGETGPDLSNKSFIYRLTGKNDFSGSHLSIDVNASYSTFYSLKTNFPVYADFHVYRAGHYDIFPSVENPHEILIDGSAVPNGTAYLGKGQHRLEIRPTGPESIFLDQVTLMPQDLPERKSASIINESRIDPSTYSVLVNSTAPFFISFARGYDPNWVAHVNGKEYKPAESFGAVNVYYIPETGINEIRIEYAGQQWFYIGALVGIGGLLAVWAYVLRCER